MTAPTQTSPKTTIYVMFCVAVGLVLLNIVVGAVGTPDLGATFTNLFRGPGYPDDAFSVVLWELRLPRALAACFAGCLLGTIGSVYQAIFRNVLAEPYLVGVSGGAALGGSVAIAFGMAGVFGLGVVGFSVVGGLIALVLALRMGRVRGVIDSQRLLISGLVIGAVLSSGMTLVLSLAGQDTNRILRWLFGSLTPMFWPSVGFLLLSAIVGTVVSLKNARALNALSISRAQAFSVGFDPDKVIKICLYVGAICTSVVVGAIGMVGFLGLIAPNLARAICRSNLKEQIILSGFIGASLLMIADLIAQRSGELPVGAITAVFGGIALLLLFGRDSSQ